jgi:hypothetical protein
LGKEIMSTPKNEFADNWMEAIKHGVSYREKYSTCKHWDSYRKYYRGQWAAGLLPVNKFFSYGRMLVPRVYFRAPRVCVTATRPDMVFHARVVEELDNLLIRELMLKYTLKMSVLDAFISGVGPIKLGYDSQYGYLPDQAITEDGETATQVSRSDSTRLIETCQMIKPGLPWAIRVRPEDVIVPWGSSDPYSLPWVAHYILRPLDDVKQDQKYRNTDKLVGTRSPEMAGSSKNLGFRPSSERVKDQDLAELWEVRDFSRRRIYTFCENELLMSADDILQNEAGPPWEFLHFNPDPEFFWAIPDAHIIAPQQEELNDTNTQAAKHRAIALLKFLYKKGALTREALESLLSGDVGPGVEIQGDDPVSAAVLMLQPHIPPDLQTACQVQIQAMREELGFSQNQEGAFSPYHGKTASESMIVNQAFEERVDERKDIMGDTIISIVRKWNWMLFRMWTEEKVIRIITPQGEPAWVKYTGDQLQGDYLLSVDVDSGMPINRSLKLQMGQELFKSANGDPMIDQVGLRQILLDNYAIVDPRVPGLLQTQYAGTPEDLAGIRQPNPAFGGGGKGSGGGRQGSSPAQPMEFEQAKLKSMGGQ